MEERAVGFEAHL